MTTNHLLRFINGTWGCAFVVGVVFRDFGRTTLWVRGVFEFYVGRWAIGFDHVGVVVVGRYHGGVNFYHRV